MNNKVKSGPNHSEDPSQKAQRTASTAKVGAPPKLVSARSTSQTTKPPKNASAESDGRLAETLRSNRDQDMKSDSQESGELRDDQMETEPFDIKKQDTSLNCTSMSIYNIYLSGSRVTRNRLKKEEGPSHQDAGKVTANSSSNKGEGKPIQKERSGTETRKVARKPSKPGPDPTTIKADTSFKQPAGSSSQPKQQVKTSKQGEDSKAEPQTQGAASSSQKGKAMAKSQSARESEPKLSPPSPSKRSLGTFSPRESVDKTQVQNPGPKAPQPSQAAKPVKKREEKQVAKQSQPKPKVSVEPSQPSPTVSDPHLLAQMAKARQAAKELVKQKQLQVAGPCQAIQKQVGEVKQSEDEPKPDRTAADLKGGKQAEQTPAKQEQSASQKPAKKAEEPTAAKPEPKGKSPVIQINDKKGDAQQLARTLRHLELIDKFEQHFPHCHNIVNRFTLYSDSTAQIKNCDQAVKAAADGVLSDYDKLQAQVQIYADSPSIPMQVKVLKFLSRVFACQLKFVEPDGISDEIRESMASDDPSKSILIVQVIDNSNKYDQSYSRFTSMHPMAFYAIGYDDLDERIILSGPLEFKNQICEIDFFDENGKSRKKENQFDVLTDLTCFESKAEFEKTSCYKPASCGSICAAALEINQRFTEYRHKLSRVEVNEKTVFNSLFTLCTFDSAEGQKRKGVLMQAKYDSQTKQHWLLLRQMQMTQAQKDKFEWVPICLGAGPDSSGIKNFHVQSDQFRGFVNLDFFKGLDNTYATGVKLRSKHLHFVSHEFHCMQLMKQVNHTVFRVPDLPRIETLADLHAHDDESKVSQWVKESVVRSEYSAIEMNAVGQPQQRGSAPCSKCNYIKEGISTLTCADCQKSWHVQCLDHSEYEQKTAIYEKQWRCPTCIRCTHCHSMVQNQKLMLLCRFCNSPYHFDCLDSNQKSQIPQFVHEFDCKKTKDKKASQSKDGKDQLTSLLQVDYKCPQCIKCISCGSKEPGKSKNYKWSKDFNFCSGCNRKRREKQFCQVCQVMWPSDKADDLLHEGPDQMICCATCNTWSHINCDLLLLNPQIKAELMANASHLAYSCQPCRRQKRINIISHLISVMEQDDKNGYYSDEFWLESDTYRSYLRQIKTPMCFAIMKRRVLAYLEQPEQLKLDCLQIFLNVKTCNRQNTQIYRDAEKMQQTCLDKINPMLATLEKQALAQKRETQYLQFLLQKNEYYIRLGKRLDQGEQTGPENEHFIVPVRSLTADADSLKRFEAVDLPQLISQVPQTVFIQEEHSLQTFIERGRRGSTTRLDSSFVLKNQSAPAANPETKSKLTKRLRRTDQQDQNSAAAINSSSCYFDKSAPNEFAIPANPLIEKGLDGASSPAVRPSFTSSNQHQFEEEKPNLKRQKLVDPYEAINKNLTLALDKHTAEPDNATPNYNHYHGRHAEKCSASGNTSMFNPINMKDKNRKKMMEHYQREDDEGCYYPNAIRCSFDDPRLIFEEMCYLCGSFGNQTDFVTCTLCAESFHTYCLVLPSNDIQGMYQSNWRCLNCKACEVCGRATEEDLLMFCGTCDRPYHSFCLSPEIKHIPEQWKCEHCFKCNSCGTNQFYSQTDIENGTNLTNKDYSLSKNFQLCYQCGRNETKKLQCNICFQKTTPEMHRRKETLKCSTCTNYSHVACSRVTVGQLRDLLNEYNQKQPDKPLVGVESVYQCLECLVAGRTINFLILESCLHYENIHNMVLKHKLLGEVCLEVLAGYFPQRYREKAPVFLERFILQNHEFFTKDQVIGQWIEMLFTDVQIDPNDFGQQMITITRVADDQTAGAPQTEVKITTEVTAEQIKEPVKNPEKQPSKTNRALQSFQNFNPFAPSDLTTQDGSWSVCDYETQANQGVLPSKRNLYRSLHRGDQNRFGQRDRYLSSKEIHEQLYSSKEQKQKLVSYLVDGSESEGESMDVDLASSSDALEPSFQQELVMLEIQAVMRIKQQFFKWFEEQFTKTMSVFCGIAEGASKPMSAPNEKAHLDDEADATMDEGPPAASDESSESVMSCCEDQEVHNPQATLMCMLCKQRGEFTMTGRLIPYKLNMYVHTSCALWTNEVFDIDDGQIVNFYQQQKKLLHQRCSICNDFGATITCAKQKGCNKHFHFPCAYRSGKVKFTRMKEAFCEQCNKARATGGSSSHISSSRAEQLEEELNFAIFPTEYIKKKRLYIVKNMEEVNQQEYENDDTDPGQHKPGKQSTQRGPKADQFSTTPKKKDLGSNGSAQGKEVEVDKWRPFYYDLFNRVGNLTVLSLRREVNQLIDIVSKDSSANGVTTIQTYLQQQQVFGSDVSARGKLPTGSQSGNLMEDLRQYLDIFSDYATIRIYWKFYGDKRLLTPAVGCNDPRSLQRAYYLYINKSKTIIELDKGDLQTVMEYCSRQIRQNQSIALLASEGQRRLNSAEAARSRAEAFPNLHQDFFWQKQLDHFKSQRSNFSLQNIEFCVEKLFGLAKYPINVWNQLELSTQDLKFNLNTQKSKLDFFLKSAIQILNATSMQYVLNLTAVRLQQVSGTGQQATGAHAQKRDTVQGTPESKEENILGMKVLSLEGVFQRMVKVNNLERNELDNGPRRNYGSYGLRGGSALFANGEQKMNQLDQLSVNQIASKHMDYNQLMIALGKGRKVDIGDHFKRLNELKQGTAGKAAKDVENALQAQQLEERRRRKKAPDQAPQAGQAVQGQDKEIQSLQTTKVNKSNLPIAMQYRSSLQNPKKVEVGPSKIHRIGLFAQENLRPKDIVIEYVGEVIRNEVADIREKRYEEKGIGDCYMFRLDDQYIIDATFFGGKARYLNHSCDANCSAKIITVDGQKHIIIRAKKQIRAGDELTYNYNFDLEEDRLSCFCGAPNCLGLY